MKKKWHFLLFIGVGLVGGACSKSQESCDASDPESFCYVDPSVQNLLLVEEKVNGKTSLSFHYDADNRLSAYHIHPEDGSTKNSLFFTYNTKNQIIAVDHKMGSEQIYKEEYTYSTGEYPTSGRWIFEDYTSLVTLTYENNRTIEKIQNEKGELLGLNTYSFDKNDNPTKIEFEIGGINISSQEYSDYDQKKYRYTQYPWPWKTRSLNNAGHYKLRNAGVVVQDQKWNYTYNSAGYPIKIEVINQDSKTLIETRTLVYKPAN